MGTSCWISRKGGGNLRKGGGPLGGEVGLEKGGYDPTYQLMVNVLIEIT